MTLILLALTWLGTIATIALWGMPWWFLPALALVPVPLVWLRFGARNASLLVAAAALALVGGLRFSTWLHRDEPSLARFVNQQLVLEGVVASEPSPSDFSNAYLIAVALVRTTDGESHPTGKLRASLDPESEYLPGTRLRLTGTLSDPPVFPDFDYRSFLRRQDVVATMSAPTVEVLAPAPTWGLEAQVTRLRLALDHSLQRSLPEPEASLAGGIAFGRDGNLPDGVYNDFRDAGLAHIVAVSGSNVSLVAAFTFALFTWAIGRRLALMPVAATLLAYLLIAGLSASVLRAGVMAAVYLVGTYLGRQQSALSALAAAAMLMTLFQPSAALDVGFQLSLSATAGLIVLGPWLRYALRALTSGAGIPRFPEVAIQAVALTLSATIATMPVTWVNFGRVSLVSPIANIVVEPLFLVAFWLSALAAAAGAIWQPAGWLVGLGAYYPLTFIVWFSHAVASLPLAAVDVPHASGTAALVVFIGLCTPGWFAYRRFPPALVRPQPQRRSARTRALQVAAGVTALSAAVVPVSLWPLRGPGDAVFTLLDAGDGDAVLITTPHGEHVLVDTGPSAIVTTRELSAALPHWERTLDATILLSTQRGEAGGLPGLRRRFEIDQVFGGPGTALDAGDHFEFDGVLFDILWVEPSGSAPGAAIIRASYRGLSLLLAGEPSSPRQALPTGLSLGADVLVIPDHGANATEIPFIESVSPAIALIPVGSGSYAPTPTPAVLESLSGTAVFRSDTHGRISLHTDGQQITFSTSQ